MQISCGLIHRCPPCGGGGHVEGFIDGFTGSGSGGGRAGLVAPGAAERFGVSAASISRWRSREREQGDARPKALGGDRRSGRIDAHMSVIVEALGPEKDANLEEVRRSLADRGLFFGFGTIQRFFKRHNITRKKRVRMPRSKTDPTS